MTNSVMVEKAREFVRKFNDDEYDFAKTTNEDHQDTLERLAFAKVDFEKADDDYTKGIDPITVQIISAYELARRRRVLEDNFENALEHLLKWMGLAKVNKLYTDRNGKETSELMKLTEINEQLSKDKLKAERKLEYIFKFHPQLKDLVEKISDTEVKEDG